MGRIKSALVKRTAKKMLGENNVFTASFEDNKKVLTHHMPDKKTRNKIAGYLARLKRTQEKERILKEEAAA